MSDTRIELGDGKYAVTRNEDGVIVSMERNGELWPAGKERFEFAGVFHAALNEIDAMRERKDGAYLERNRCVALIARMALSLGCRAGTARTAIEGWSDDWHGCVYIDLPTGQVSWHFHDSQAHLFEALPPYNGVWDGHDTPTKYERVAAAFAELAPAVGAEGPAFDLVAHLARQVQFSRHAFGPGDRTAGVCDHIRKELREVQDDAAAGKDTLPEWVDCIILAFDGAWRSGATPEQIVDAIVAKQTKNEGRVWPDWRTADPNKAIEHDRSHDVLPPIVSSVALQAYPLSPTDEEIDALCAPGRGERWRGDGRQYDRDTARLVLKAFAK